MKRTWDPTIPAVLAAIVMLFGTVAVTGGIAPGEWRADIGSNPRTVRLNVRLAEGIPRTNLSTDVDTSELSGFDAAAFGRSGAPLHLAWKRDAGTFVLEGEGGRRPGGKVRFEPNGAFGERWRSLGFGTLDTIDSLRLAVHNVRMADVERLHELGYDGVDADALIRLESEPGLLESLEEAHAQGLHLAFDDLFRLRAHGVPVDYVARVHASGYSDVGDVIRLHDQGVDADYVRGLVESDLPGLTLDDIVRLHAHGVSPDFVRSLAQAGRGDLTVDDVIRARAHASE